MSRLIERSAMVLARIIAGPERHEWVNAMEGELSILPERRLDWALGSLVAALKDRGRREQGFIAALAILPAMAIVSLPILTIAIRAIAHVTGLSQLPLMPLMTLAPLPFAFLLATLRPAKPWLVGIAGFAIYQAIPAIGFRILFGAYVYVRWEANLSYYGLLPPLGLIATFAVWLGGSYWGARWSRARRVKRLS